MKTPSQFDFGFESRTTDFRSAKVILIFEASLTSHDIGMARGPLAVADAGQYAEFYEIEGSFSPFEIGVCSEIIEKENIDTRVSQAIQQNKFPIVISDTHLQVDLRVDANVMRNGPGWYELIDSLEMDFKKPIVTSAALVGVGDVEPKSPKALLCAQILVKMVASIWKAGR